MKPIIKWSGGKTEEIKYIKEYIPKDALYYCEPFIGGGALFFDFDNDVFEKILINDIHPELVIFYKMLKENRSKDISPVLTL